MKPHRTFRALLICGGALVAMVQSTLTLGAAYVAVAQSVVSSASRVQGTVVDAEGRPVGGATVRQYGYRQLLMNRAELGMLQQVTSDDSGHFELQVTNASPVPQAPVFLTARKTGLASAWTQVAAVGGAEPRLVLTPPSFMAGQVLDAADKPVTGATVTVAVAFSQSIGPGMMNNFNYLSDTAARDLFSATSGADGRFRIEGFPTNGSAALVAEAPGKVMRSTSPENFSPNGMPHRPGQDDIRLVLETAGSVEGQIVSSEPDGKPPVAQIRVNPNGPGFFSLGARQPDQSASDGTFRLNNLPGGSFQLMAAFGTNATADWVAEMVPVVVEAGQTTRGVQITAIRGGLLEVAVRSTNGPVAEAGVNVYRERFQSGLTAGTNGVAVLRLPPGDYQVNAYKQGWQPANASGTVEVGKTNRVELELIPPRKLTGIVRLPDGKPATNLALQVVGDWSMQQANFKTDADGKFEIEWNSQRFPGNNMTPCLLAREPSRNLAIAQDLDDESDKLDLRLAPALSFATRVECDGKPITNAVAALVFWTGNSGMHLNGLSSATNAPGQVEIVALPPGRRYGLQITAPGFGSRYMDLSQSSDEAKRVELDPVELRRADRKLAGKLVDSDDKAVSGAMVQIHGDGQPNGVVTTDREGKFSFDVCEGTVRLFANLQQSFANMTAEAGDTNVVMKLGERNMDYGGGAKPQKLTGTVNDADNKPVAGAEVSVFPMDGSNRAKTGTNGTFSLTYVVQPWQRQQGNPWVIARDRARNLAVAEELQEEGTNVTLHLESALMVRGKVVGPDNQPLPKAQVSLMMQTGRMGGNLDDQPAIADAQGVFTFNALPMNQDYTLYANLSGYSNKRQKIEVDWETNVVDVPPLLLRIPNQIIAGKVVDAKDKPVAGVHVQVASDDQPQSSMQTDSKGRFKFKVCEGQIHMYASGQIGFAQATVDAGDTNIVILLTDRSVRSQATTRRRPANASALKGKPLPDLAALGFAADAVPAGKPVLLCLMDVQQRPSRRTARLLTEQLDSLRAKGLTVLGLQTVQATKESWDDWKEANPVQFPVSRLAEPSEKSKWATSLENLPWLILTDKKGIVADEGFGLEDLEAKLDEVNKQ